MSYIIGIGIVAVLFIVFGFLKPGDNCSGTCTSCSSSCLFKHGDHHG